MRQTTHNKVLINNTNSCILSKTNETIDNKTFVSILKNLSLHLTLPVL